jgi:hypothetical protein
VFMVQRKVVYRAPRFDVEQVVEKLQDGRELPRTIIRHPGAVVILPVLDDGRVHPSHSPRQSHLPPGLALWHLRVRVSSSGVAVNTRTAVTTSIVVLTARPP